MATCQGNEPTCNSSGNTWPQSSQLTEPLDWSWPKKWNCCAWVDLYFKKEKKKQRQWMNCKIFPQKFSQAKKMPPFTLNCMFVCVYFLVCIQCFEVRGRHLINFPWWLSMCSTLKNFLHHMFMATMFLWRQVCKVVLKVMFWRREMMEEQWYHVKIACFFFVCVLLFYWSVFCSGVTQLYFK